MAANRDPLGLARGLREVVEGEAAAAEEAGTMTATVVDALDDAGLFSLLVPAELGGTEADPATIIDVCAELSYADGAVGWAFAQNTTVGAYLAYVDRDVAVRYAGQRAGAGMFAPLGVAQVEPGGYRISGQFSFGSGSGHATFMGGSALIMDGEDVGPFGDDGSPPVVGFLVPIDGVELRDNWDVMGLRGTGSYDFEVHEQFVDAGATWRIFQPGVCDRITGGPLYGLGAIVVGTIGSAAWAVGVADRALDEITDIATGGRARLAQTPLAEQQIFQRDLGLHATAVAAGRALIVEAYTAAVGAVADQADDDDFGARLRQTKTAANYMTRVAREAVDFAWAASGSLGIRNPSTLQRCFRDIHVGAGHMVFDDRNYIELAKTRLGIEASPF